MSESKTLAEPQLPACKTLVALLSRLTGEMASEGSLRLMVLDDLLTKLDKVNPEFRLRILYDGVKTFLPPDVQNRLTMQAPLPTPKERRMDVAVMTVIPPELRAAKHALGINTTTREHRNIHGLRFWEQTVKRDAGTLEVVLTMIGEPGNTSCAAACDRLFSIYNVDLCILVGIAAGLKGKVALGDVVAADIVLDYEYGRAEPAGLAPRPRPFPLDGRILRDLHYFEPTRVGWHNDLRDCVARVCSNEPEFLPVSGETWCPMYHTGVVLAGEKLIANGRLPEMRAEYHDRVRAAEMEGAGFARLCNEHNVPWLVFRGISDYGDPEKDDSWQAGAALSAATTAICFLKNDYRRPDDRF